MLRNLFPIKGKVRTAAHWAADGKVYPLGVALQELDTYKVKVSDGAHRFSELPYLGVLDDDSGASGTRKLVVCPTVNFDTQHWVITDVDDVAQTFKISGNHTALLPDGSTFSVIGSTGNDSVYTIVSKLFAAGVTTIITAEPPLDTTPDGSITNINTYGAPIYVPAVGEWLIDAWPCVTTSFNGSPSHTDIALAAGFAQASSGLYNYIAGEGNAPQLAESDITNGSASDALSGFRAPAEFQNASLASAVVKHGTQPWRPIQFISTDPLLCVVSEGGHPSDAPSDATAGSIVWILDIGVPE